MPATPDGGFIIDDTEVEQDRYGPDLDPDGPGARRRPVAKHADHDQSDHGNWATGESSATAAAGDKAWSARHPDGNLAVRNLAQSYLRSASMPPMRDHEPQNLTPEEGRRIADWYDSAPQTPNDPATQDAYRAFRDEIGKQYDAAIAAGYTFEVWSQPGQPYANSAEMRADVRDNKHLYYFATEGTESTTPNALMPPEDNDKFRAVHDLFGHALSGNQFGPKGETNAFLDHSQMFSDKARLAMATETLGQNAWFNFSRANEGKEVKDRDFAEQKAFLLDPSLYADLLDRTAESFVKGTASFVKHADHDQSTHGNRDGASADSPADGKPYGDAPGSQRRFATDIFARTIRDGGSTIDISTGRVPRSGFAVAVSKDSERAIPVAEFNAQHVRSFIDDNREVLERGRYHLGTWRDDSTDTVFLDISVVVDDRADAEDLAREHAQRAFFDLERAEEIETKVAARSPRRWYHRLLLRKHADHDQSTHGNRDGAGQPATADDLASRAKALFPKMDRSLPATGSEGALLTSDGTFLNVPNHKAAADALGFNTGPQNWYSDQYDMIEAGLVRVRASATSLNVQHVAPLTPEQRYSIREAMRGRLTLYVDRFDNDSMFLNAPPGRDEPAPGAVMNILDASNRKVEFRERLRATFAKEFDPNQPRDEAGRWTSTGATLDREATVTRLRVPLETKGSWSRLSSEQKDLIAAHLAKHKIDEPAIRERLAALYDRAASSGKLSEFRNWYRDQHNRIADSAARLGMPADTLTAMVAAYSPQADWERNMHGTRFGNPEWAEHLASVLRKDDPYTVSPEVSALAREKFGVSIEPGTYRPSEVSDPKALLVTWNDPAASPPYDRLPIYSGPDNAAKAVEIYRGADPDEVLSGAKVRSFYNNLSDPANRDFVTVDTHMRRAMLGGLLDKGTVEERRFYRNVFESPSGKGLGNDGSYAWWGSILADEAAKRGMLPHEFMAALWGQWRAEHGRIEARMRTNEFNRAREAARVAEGAA